MEAKKKSLSSFFWCMPFWFAWVNVLAAVQPCDTSRPASTWSDCVGRYDYSSGDSYFGQFNNGRFHGLGRFTTLEGIAYVGFFRFGERDGAGVEYSRFGNVLREGYWRGMSFKNEKLNLQLFPFKNDLIFDGPVYLGGGVNSADLQRSYQAAVIRIKELEAELAEERKKNVLLQEDVRRRSSSPPSPSVVTDCLGKGLRPGTAEFSRCIGN